MFMLFGIILISIMIVVALWVKGIDKMQEKHPDYRGEDFLDWDDNKQHTENV